MKWVIKNPAPRDSRLHKWGDYHFGRLLSKHLSRRGETVETHYHCDWDQDVACDVVLVLRGKHAFTARPAQHAGATWLLWNISHPNDVTDGECEPYDLVATASLPRAQTLGARLSTPVVPLLQCTDPEEFAADLRRGDEPRRGFVFVGNTRASLRPGVMWAIEYGLPLRIWGRGWDRWRQAQEHVVADYYPNEQLGWLYARSRATINDHWQDMKVQGFINNRVLDALACGLPVVSDWHEELARVFPDEVLYYRSQDDFEGCMERLLLEYPTVQDRAASAGAKVRRKFTFEQRAAELIGLVEGLT
jgi:hypothetical protein